MTINIGIVGAGYGQYVLLPALREDRRAEVVAICASTQQKADAVAAEHGIERAYGDWRALVAAPDVDAVAVATPPDVQPAIAVEAARAGKPLFLEKPLALTLDDAEYMAGVIGNSGVPNVIDFEFPEIDAWQEARALLPTLGSLRHIEVNWHVENYANRHHLDTWKARALPNYVSHVFYNLEWFVGERVARLSARLTGAPNDERDADTVNVIAAEFESGLLASITVSNHAFMGSGHRWTFYGDDGTLDLHNPTRDYIYGFKLRHATRTDHDLHNIPLPVEDAATDGRRLASGRVAARWLDWVEKGVATHPTVADGLRVQTLLHAAEQSDKARRWLDVG